MVQQGISSDVFQRVHRKRIGQTIRRFNSLEWIAGQFTRYRFHDFDLFQVIPLLEQITVDELNKRLAGAYGLGIDLPLALFVLYKSGIYT